MIKICVIFDFEDLPATVLWWIKIYTQRRLSRRSFETKAENRAK